ncbi:MAG: universal stress protein [Idiomarina sp.]|nr:universal stress protein [Idiomarina sp.]
MTMHTVACIDGSALSDVVADYAAWSAERMGTELVLLNVLDDVRASEETDFSGNIGMDERQRLLAELADLEEKRAKLARQQGHTFLEAARKHVQERFEEPVLRQRHGDLVDTLSELESEIRLLVIGRQGKRGAGIGQHIGHQVERVIRALHRPTWVVHGEFKAPERIMIAFDNSATAKKAVEMVAGSPLFRGIPVDVVMVGADTGDHQQQLQWAEGKLKDQGFAVTTAIIAGDVEEALNEYAKTHQVDAMVMGAYGHSRIREFLVGSHTNALIKSAKVPLLLLR